MNILTMTNEEWIAHWKSRAKPQHKFMTLNVSPWHMAVFPEFHENLDEIKQKLLHEFAAGSHYF